MRTARWIGHFWRKVPVSTAKPKIVGKLQKKKIEHKIYIKYKTIDDNKFIFNVQYL